MLKIGILAILVLSAGYNLVVLDMRDKADSTSGCHSKLESLLAPWGSRCFYTLDLNKPQLDVSKNHLLEEKARLDDFKYHDGVDTEILWYRAKFHRRFKNEFRINFKELHEMHADYTRSEHRNLLRQTEYLHFLYQHDLHPLAQETLDSYCDDYLPFYKFKVVQNYRKMFREFSIDLDLTHCISLLGPTYQAELIEEM